MIWVKDSEKKPRYMYWLSNIDESLPYESTLKPFGDLYEFSALPIPAAV
jgi:hypothetical protein